MKTCKFGIRLNHTLAAVLTGIALSISCPLAARVFTTPEAALQAAFPKAKISVKRLYLTPEQKEEIQRRLSRPVPNRLYTVYVAMDDSGHASGYGFLHTTRVRSKEQTLFITVTPDERIRSVTLISFFEPEEYMPPGRWLRIFEGKGNRKGGPDALMPGVDIPVISGATLTTRSCAETARLVLMLVPLARQIP